MWPTEIRVVRLPRRRVAVARQLPRMDGYANSVGALGLAKAMGRPKDAPCAFGVRLRRALRACGYGPGVADPHRWITLKRADGATGAGTSSLASRSAGRATGAGTGEPKEKINGATGVASL